MNNLRLLNKQTADIINITTPKVYPLIPESYELVTDKFQLQMVMLHTYLAIAIYMVGNSNCLVISSNNNADKPGDSFVHSKNGEIR